MSVLSNRRPRVSVLLPVRDAAATLPACLASLGRQTEPRWECVAVDDGSADDTPQVLNAAARADPRIRVVPGPPRGLVAALQEGLAHCRAPVVARMDADDLMHRRRLADQLALLERRADLDGIGCHVRLFPRAALGEGYRDYERWLNSIDGEEAVRREAFVECPLAHPTLAVRRDVLLATGYRDRGWPEDYDLVLRLLAAGRRLGVVPRRRLAWRHRPGRLSRTSARYDVSRFVACKAHFLARGPLAGCERYVLWGHGRTGRMLAAALRRHGRHAAAIVEIHPGRIGNLIGGAPVIPPESLGPPGARGPLVASVAGAGPRGEIRRWLEERGWIELRDFVCAA